MPSEVDNGGQQLEDISYQLVWVTRRRRPFLEGAVLTRTVELLTEAADEIGVVVTRIASGGDYLVVSIAAPPELAPSTIVSRLKRHSASALRREYPALRALPSIWTRRELVTTQQAVPENRIRSFVERQPRNERRPVKRIAPRLGGYPGGPEIEVVAVTPLDPEEPPDPPVIVDEP